MKITNYKCENCGIVFGFDYDDSYCVHCEHKDCIKEIEKEV